MGKFETPHHVRDCRFDENEPTHEITSLPLRKTKMGTRRERVKRCRSLSRRAAGWAAGSCFSLLQAIIGFQPDAPNGKLYIDPRLPDWMPEFT
ncbi:hypothetical protein [Mesorhizobium sp. LNHC221B00]|uniref:hypothetical protein n=1 Tax=Mesorhizobium sp. LNHC221B00 TaxID=1287233 RepID=UPI0018DE9A14|nr:hypothetical protein [Mesorhizobium sp. LNHC221B00]